MYTIKAVVEGTLERIEKEILRTLHPEEIPVVEITEDEYNRMDEDSVLWR